MKTRAFAVLEVAALRSFAVLEGVASRGIQTAAELKEFDRLLSAGKSRAEALRLIQGMRAMQTGHGLPTSEQASQAVLDRNVKGRWPE